MRASSEKPEEYSTISPLAAMAISSLLGRLTVLYHTSEESLMKMHDRDLSELKVGYHLRRAVQRGMTRDIHPI